MFALVCSVCFATFLAEVAARLTYKWLAPEQGKRNLRIFLEQDSNRTLFSEQPHPYLLWENTPNFIGENGLLQTNKSGYRNTKNYSQEPANGTLRILALGGSTTYGYLQDSPDSAWPSQAEAMLQSVVDGSREYTAVEVVNGGLNYATTAELLSHYMFRDRYLKPGIVVIHVGGNDAAPLLYDDYNPEYTHFRPGWSGSPHRLRFGERNLLETSGLARLLYSRWLDDAPAVLFCDKQCKPLDLDPSFYTQNAQKNSPVGFERNLELLIRTLQGDGVEVVLFPFILSNDKIFSSLHGLPAERAAYTKNSRNGMKIAIAKHLEIMRSLSEQYKTHWVGLEAESIPIAAWLDHCHLSPDGDQIKAKAVAETIKEIIHPAEAEKSAQ